MKIKSIFTLSFSLLVNLVWAQWVTHNPKVEEASVDYVKITKVEITDQHTAIHLRYEDDRSAEVPIPPNIPPMFREFYRQQMGKPQIWLDPNTRLYKPGDVNTKFRFLRAEGIPTNPERKEVDSGEVIEFIAYFERVTPGIEVIDFYEGRSTGQTTAWNFYGIHIQNPDPKKKPARPVTPPETIAEKPVEDATSKAIGALPIIGLKGNILNAHTGEPIMATIDYIENGDTISVNTRSGKYRLALEPGQKYKFIVSADGYHNEIWELGDQEESAENGVIDHDFRLIPLSEGTTFTLENIYFETSSYSLLPESYDELDRFVKMLQANPGMTIRVEGHTDNIGNFDKNVELSQQRAESVKNYLVEKGIAADRIETKGYGPTKPVSKGSTEAERQKNRRVEIVILKT